ncbi:ATP-binding protein [Streptomyces sp. B6B3]|uniref:ATP-binding protein n=1 Tax=Streptomyces sp. B6B3 TaxID=3153570 RepID=UPI00325DD032
MARRTARRIVGDWCLPLSADDVELAVSELVGNAVHHAARNAPRGRVTVVFRAWSRWLLVEVADESPVPPAFPVGSALSPQPPGLAEGGRGLYLVGCLADGVWWSARESGGKSVFCRFRFRPFEEAP